MVTRKQYDNIIEHKILVIGSGIAGLLAAVSCSRFTDDIGIVSKGKMGWSGATACCGGNAMTICMPEDNPDEWMEKYVVHSDYTVDQEWVRIFIDESYHYATVLNELGKKSKKMVYPHQPDDPNKFWRIERTGNKCTIFNLPEAQNILRNEIRKQGLDVYERVSIVQLLCHENRVVGAVGIQYRTGDIYLFKSEVVILAAGSCTYSQDLFEICGEGFAMAYHAGAKMMSFDRGGAISRPRKVMHNGTLFSSTANSSGYQMGGRMVNRFGEDFFKKMTPEMKKAGRLGQNMAIQKELDEGRGPIFEDYTNLSPYVKDVMKSMRVAQWKRVRSEYQLDPLEEKICVEDGVEQTYTPDSCNRMGGVAIDYQNMSSIQGLFVVGDNSAPVLAMQHPFGGCELGWAVLSGSRVGKSVEAFISTHSPVILSDNWYDVASDNRLCSLRMYLRKEAGILPDILKQEIFSCMIPYDVVHSDAEHLQEAIEKINNIRSGRLPEMWARDYHELKEAIEVESLLDVSEMILRSELVRKESRVGVRRRDYPKMDNLHWLKWITIQKIEDAMILGEEPIPTPYINAPLDIDYPPQHRV